MNWPAVLLVLLLMYDVVGLSTGEKFRIRLSRHQVRMSDSSLLRHRFLLSSSSSSPHHHQHHLNHRTQTKKPPDHLVALKNYLGTMYIGQVQIDGVEYQVQIDTGSADLWISCHFFKGAECNGYSCPVGTITIQYGSGNVCVQPKHAKVQFGHISLPHYAFGVGFGENVAPSSANSVVLGGSQGILGLAYKDVAAISRSGRQIIDAVQNFSMYLSPKEGQKGSLLILNGVDEELMTKYQMKGFKLPLKEKRHWTVSISRFQTGEESDIFPCLLPIGRSCSAIVDSGTSFLTAPDFIFTQFANRYLLPNDCYFYQDGFYICPRQAKLPRLAFTLGNGEYRKKFYLNPWDYSRVYSSKEIVIQIQQSPKGSVSDMWILGDTFLKVYYTSYAIDKSITIFCPKGKCNGGKNLLEFPSEGLSSWQIILIAVCSTTGAVFTSVGIWYYLHREKQQLKRSRSMSFYCPE